ncbi:hypothetical protein [Candidatus Mesenet endosymbiont of Agriotes lineatus]|uniref:hypothetical protein n=1 Tax=Candidatus Mesenet endosymbiont of Agriotes lineatus TaxID=3077948 RepID=UPI0030D2B9AA
MSVLNDTNYEAEVDSIYDELDHQIITPNADITTFKKELIIIWFGHNTFRHVFCGEVNLGECTL